MGAPVLANDSATFQRTTTPFDTFVLTFAAPRTYTVEGRAIIIQGETIPPIGGDVVVSSAVAVISKVTGVFIMLYPSVPPGVGFFTITGGPHAGWNHIATTRVAPGVNVNFD